jgi:hypothetical protein
MANATTAPTYKTAHLPTATTLHPVLTFRSSQGCTAVSIDTCTALVRFMVHFWGHNPKAGWGTRGFLQTLYPYPRKPVLWTWVQVFMGTGTGYPRVAHDSP